MSKLLSAALASELKRKLIFKDQARINQAFEYYDVSLAGLDEDPEIVRGTGVSFNPRPSRLLQLALQHLAAISIEDLCALLFSCRNITPDLVSGEWEGPLSQADDLSAALNTLEIKTFREVAIKTQFFCLIHWLDKLRHLHMSKYSVTQRQQIITQIKQQLDLLDSEVAASDLFKLTTTAITKASSLCK